MKNRDLVSSLFWMGFGILFLIGAMVQGLIRRGIPGPGFVPFIVAAVLICLSLSVFFPALVKKTKESEGQERQRSSKENPCVWHS